MPPFCAKRCFAAGDTGPSFTSSISSSRRRADQFLHARRIVHARQLHQDLGIGAGPAVLLHGWFGQTQAALMRLLDGIDAALHGVGFERRSTRWASSSSGSRWNCTGVRL